MLKLKFGLSSLQAYLGLQDYAYTVCAYIFTAQCNASAERSYATVSRLSVCPSVRPSVRLSVRP